MHFTFHNLIDWENILSILKIKLNYFCSIILDTKVYTRKIQRSTGKYVPYSVYSSLYSVV